MKTASAKSFGVLPLNFGAGLNAQHLDAMLDLYKIWSGAQSELMAQAARSSQRWLDLVGKFPFEQPKSLRGMMQAAVNAQRQGYEEWRSEVQAMNDAAARCAYDSAECASELLPDADLGQAVVVERKVA